MTGVSSRAGKLPDPSMLANIPQLMTAYYTRRPDPSIREQRVTFGTSGHRGSALASAFNEAHILAITQAICRHRQEQGIDGPLFFGIDTHALSESAVASALEVLAANRVDAAPGNGAPIGGLKVVTPTGWFAARPSGTEDVYKLYAESFKGREHLARIQSSR